MWVLLIIVFTVEGQHGATLETYANERDCRRAKVRVELLMHQAYPNDHDYRLVCQKRAVRASHKEVL